QTASRNIGDQFVKYHEEEKKVLDEIEKGDVVSLEYTNYRNVNAPDLSNFRFIAQKHVVAGWSMDFNASLTFFNKKPTTVRATRVRDFDFALQFETRLRDLGFG